MNDPSGENRTGAADVSASQHVMVCALKELGSLVQSLSATASPLIQEPSVGMMHEHDMTDCDYRHTTFKTTLETKNKATAGLSVYVESRFFGDGNVGAVAPEHGGPSGSGLVPALCCRSRAAPAYASAGALR